MTPIAPARGLLLCLSDYPVELVAGWVAGSDVEVAVLDRAARPADHGELLARADVVIADAARRLVLDADAIGLLERCRLVVVPAAGIDGSVDETAAAAAGLTVLNTPGYNADAVADWTIGAIIDALRAPTDLRDSGWVASPLGRELGAVTVGLVGHGAIGRAIRRRLTGFGTNVLYTRSSPPSPSDPPGRVSLAELFTRSDVVSLHAPLTPQTAGMIGAEQFAAMPDNSVFINAARGGLVVEADLVAALRAGRPARAVLDVFVTEPLPADHPLRSLDTARLTPHVAAGTRQARQRVRAMVGAAVREAFGLQHPSPRPRLD